VPVNKERTLEEVSLPMETGLTQACFFESVSPEQLRKEKEKARDLRRSQWWKRQLAKGACHYCRGRIPPAELTMDHIVPLSRGGKSVRGNTVPACKDCNNRKKYLLPIEWDLYIRRISEDLHPEGGTTED
jgi:5-methylcytosine-specific restriction endonuclease McrA